LTFVVLLCILGKISTANRGVTMSILDIFNPKKKAAKEAKLAISGDLKKFTHDLEALISIEDPLERFVAFFVVTSPWSDRGIENLKSSYKAAKEKIPELEGAVRDIDTLSLHFYRAGRDLYGLNRTSRGATPTADNVYLGNYDDMHPVEAALRSYLLTKTVRDCMNEKGILPMKISQCVSQHYQVEEQHPMTYRRAREIQALSFMKAHIPKMRDLVDKITAHDLKLGF
jgi:hypothetical protein